ncbi:hypothetical protein [Bacillus massilinigeriensis]|uniref:hypothetical protein n=1 Tax=Bacillus mediterraneensis TaxID=1805474 RepID=UPI0008F7EE37|nr:hypothetical protein [Bacillus mediterraneensis]
MIILESKGYELEKEKSNTSEDFFNRSEVNFLDSGQEKTFRVLYIRFFDEKLAEFTPFEQDPLFSAGGRQVSFKDIVALACLLENPGNKYRKRLYINSEQELRNMMQRVDFERLKEVFDCIVEKGQYEVRSPLDFILAER